MLSEEDDDDDDSADVDAGRWQRGSLRKLGVPYFGALIIRILLFRVLD